VDTGDDGDGDDLWRKGKEELRRVLHSSGRKEMPNLLDLPSRLDRCVVCGKLITEDMRSRPLMLLSKRTRPPAKDSSSIMLVVHAGCEEAGAGLARHQGYGWRRQEVEESPSAAPGSIGP
jgi:hypothetical protein